MARVTATYQQAIDVVAEASSECREPASDLVVLVAVLFDRKRESVTEDVAKIMETNLDALHDDAHADSECYEDCRACRREDAERQLDRHLNAMDFGGRP